MKRRCQPTWLHSYRDYTAESESPDTFHIWTALSCLSAVVRRHVWIDYGLMNLYPNLYVLLVSPPGTCRKSVAMSLGTKLLQKVPGVHIEPNQLNPATLIRSLSSGGNVSLDDHQSGEDRDFPVLREESSAMLVSPEFSTTIGRDAADNGMLSLLTHLFDCPDFFDKETISRDREEAYNIYLSILGATTPNWRANCIPDDAIGTGFISRFILVCESVRRKSNSWPLRTPKEEALMRDLIRDLIHIEKNLHGVMKPTKEFRSWFDDYYEGRPTSVSDEKMAYYFERKHIHLLKIAMLSSIAERDDLIVTKADGEMAMEFLERVEGNMSDAFKEAERPTGRDVDRVTQQLQKAPDNTLTWQELLNRNMRYLKRPDFRALVETMIETGMVQVTISGGRWDKIILNPMRKP